MPKRYPSLCCNGLIAQLMSENNALNPLWAKRSYRLKFLLRTYVLYPRSLIWLNTLSHYDQKALFLSRQTNLPCKLHRPYLTSAFSFQARLQALIEHYDTISGLSLPLIRALYGETPWILGTIEGKNDSRYIIQIQSNDKYAREGELTLSFVDPDQHALANLTFSIVKYDEKPSLFIAGLQGENHENMRSYIQNATKNCYGLFPKHALFCIAQTLTQFFELTQIVAVSNETHVYTNWQYRRKRYPLLYACYDDFWTSLGGIKNQDRLFILPIKEHHKNMGEISSKKRAQYHNRYRLQDALHRSVLSQLYDIDR